MSMTSVLRRFPYTLAALQLAFLVLVAATVWHIHVFELTGFNIVGIEENELGEIGIAFLLVIPAVFIDRVVARQRTHEAQLQAEQLRVLRVTMRTVQDIVNNNLNQLQLLRMDAEGHVPDETLALFDTALHATADQLSALGNLTVFAEMPMASGSGLDIRASSALQSDSGARFVPPANRRSFAAAARGLLASANLL